MDIKLTFTDPEIAKDPKAQEWLRTCNHILNESIDIEKVKEKALALYLNSYVFAGKEA